MNKIKKIDKNQLNQLGLLYLVGLCGDISSRIRFQKLVCLTQYLEKNKTPFSFDFKSYYYGPYSEDLRNDVDLLVQVGLINEKINIINNDTSVFSYSYTLSENGTEYLNSFLNKISKIKEKLFLIDKVVSNYNSFSTDIIVKEAKKVSGIESLPKR